MFYNYSQKYKKCEAWCEVMFQALGLCGVVDSKPSGLKEVLWLGGCSAS